MKTKRNLIGFTLFILLFALLALTGCSQEKESATGYIGISVDEQEKQQSREINGDNEAWYADTEKLYWTYKATKVSGDDTGKKTREYIVGKVSENPQDRKGLREKPIGPLAVGEWKIELFGYLNDTSPDGDGYATGLSANTRIYESKEVITWKIKSSTEDWEQVKRNDNLIKHVELKAADSLEGWLEFSDEYYSLSVPDKMAFRCGFVDGEGVSNRRKNNIKLRFLDVTDSNNPVIIAESTTVLNDGSSAGEVNVEKNNNGEVTVVKLKRPEFKQTDRVLVKTDDSGNTHYYFPFSTTPTGLRTFVFVVEYMDGYTVGNNENISGSESEHERRARYSATDTFYEQDYAPVGDIISYQLKFVGGVAIKLSGDVNDIKANGGDVEKLVFNPAFFAITYWTRDTDREYGYYKPDTTKAPKRFATLQEAVQTWLDDNGNDSENQPKQRITAIRNIDNAGVVSTLDGSVGVDIPVYPDGFYIDNLIVNGGANALGSVIFCVPDTDSGKKNDYSRLSKYKFSPYKEGDTPVNPSVKNFSCKGGDSAVLTHIQVKDALCDFTAQSNHSIYLSGTVKKVNLGRVASDPNDSATNIYVPTLMLGTKDSCEITELAVFGGEVEFGGYTKVENLTLVEQLAEGSSLKGVTSAYIGNLNDYIRFGKIARPGYPVTSSAALSEQQKKAFKKIVLHGNNATESPSVQETKKTLYGIEGMELELQAFNELSSSPWTKTETTDTDETELVFVNWNKDRVLSDDPAVVKNNTVKNKDVLTVTNFNAGTASEGTLDLYAVWAQSLGGRVFYVGGGVGDWDKYHFYGADCNELLYWRGSSNMIRALDAAVYGLKTSGSEDMVYIAYTKPDTTVRVTDENVSLYEPDTYNWHTDYHYEGTGVDFKEDGIGKGKVYTNAVLNNSSMPETEDDHSLFWGIRALRDNTEDNKGHKDWFIGSKAEYVQLAYSSVPRPVKITTLTENADGNKVFECSSTPQTSTWMEVVFNDSNPDTRKPAFLLPIRSF